MRYADFAQYPPVTSDRNGYCCECGTEVPAGAGLTVLGYENGAVAGIVLDRACAGAVRTRQEQQKGAAAGG